MLIILLVILSIFFKGFFDMILMSALKHVELFSTHSLPDAPEDVDSDIILRLQCSMLYFFLLCVRTTKKEVKMFHEK
jgi:hypothetical protein